MTPVRAIRAKCFDCTGGQLSEIKNCDCVNCPLYPYKKARTPKPDYLSKWQEERLNWLLIHSVKFTERETSPIKTTLKLKLQEDFKQ